MEVSVRPGPGESLAEARRVAQDLLESLHAMLIDSPVKVTVRPNSVSWPEEVGTVEP